MFILLNLFVIGGVLIIAYWWANQGLFSAILHTLCVIAAGAIALAAWEPVMYGFLLKGNALDNFAWGLVLIILFLVILVVLRISMDKAVGANVKLPAWANLVFGFPIGAVAGVITMGILIIGSGFIQSVKDPFGYNPVHRSGRTGQIVVEGPMLWLPVDKLTSEFYSWLSVTSLKPLGGKPLRHVQPDLWAQASLVRDSYGKGKAALAMPPSAVNVKTVYYSPESNTYAVEIHFGAGARDFGTQVTLSRAQIRLVGAASGTAKPPVVYPNSWTQPEGHFSFDDVSHYITSEPGQQSVDVVVFFQAGQMGQNARYLQIRNTRFRIGRIQQVPPSRIQSLRGPGAGSTGADAAANIGGSIDSVILVSENPRPIRASKNSPMGSIELQDEKFYSGEHLFSSNPGRISGRLAIEEFYVPPGTRMVQLTITRGGPADIYAVADEVEPGAELMLVDNQARTYWPIGYMHIRPENIALKLAPTDFVKTMPEIPLLPTSGTHTMRLLFIVTQDVTLTSFRFGNKTIGTCNVHVDPPR